VRTNGWLMVMLPQGFCPLPKSCTDQKLQSALPDGCRRGHFPQMWQLNKIYGREKFVALSGRKVVVKVPKMLKCGRIKNLKIPNKTDRNTVTYFYQIYKFQICLFFKLFA
jgi:hypothetical protein